VDSDEKLAIHPYRRERTLWRDMGKPSISESKVPWAWGYQFKHFQGLQELEMVFETISEKSKLLDAVVQNALAWKFDLADERVLTTEGCPVVQSRWKGFRDEDGGVVPPANVPNAAVPSSFSFSLQAGNGGSGQTGGWLTEHDHPSEVPRLFGGKQDEYYVICVRWRAKKI
jgi:hypothetical protein